MKASCNDLTQSATTVEEVEATLPSGWRVVIFRDRSQVVHGVLRYKEAEATRQELADEIHRIELSLPETNREVADDNDDISRVAVRRG